MLTFNQPTFEDLSTKEWLVTNGLGGYAASSISGANTRRYHGLLVTAQNPPTGRIVVVSKIEESIVVHHDSILGLSTNRYPGVIHPQGFQYLEKFERAPFPTFHFRVNESRLVKSVWMPQGSNTTVVEYQNKGNQAIHLQLNPLFVHRDYHDLFSEQAFFNFYADFKSDHTAVIYAHYGAPALYFSFTKGMFTRAATWFKNFEYEQEAYRGLDNREDAHSLGTLEVKLEAGEKIFLTFSQEEGMIQADPEQLKKEAQDRWAQLQENHKAKAAAIPLAETKQFMVDLATIADQFIVQRASTGGQTIIAGYHWFTDWGRDTMIAMRGLVIALDKQELAQSIVRTFLQYLDGGMLPNRFPDQGEEPEYNTIDAGLWLFVVLYEYWEKFQDLDFIESIFPKLTEILETHIKGTRFNIHLLKENLIFGGEGIAQLTWMDARVGDYVVTPRHGCPVEINALWYNALMIHQQFANFLGETESCFDKLAAQVKTSFREYFLRPEGYLNDVIIPGEYEDGSIRPNQVYALSLPFPLLNKQEGAIILQQIKDELLTPLGLRSLTPDHPDFIGRYGGDQWKRDTAYHQGTVWVFLIGEYWLAYLRHHDYSKKAQSEVLKSMTHLRRHFYENNGLYGISEIFDGAEPGTGRGCVQQAWSVGMILKVLLSMGTKSGRKKAVKNRRHSAILFLLNFSFLFFFL